MKNVWMLGVAALLAIGDDSFAQQLKLATAAEGRVLLSTSDVYTQSMSAFDRAARLKTARDVAEADYLKHSAAAALDWSAEESAVVLDAWGAIEKEVKALKLPLPPQVVLIKTSGAEEGGAAYTREKYIVLPEGRLTTQERDLRSLLAHELFHVATRNSPDVARKLYANVGFTPCEEAVLPEGMYKITNPDAPRNNYCVEVTHRGEKVLASPAIFTRGKYDTASGKDFFEFLQLALLLRSPTPPTEANLVEFGAVTGLFEQVGRNTNYLLHVEELLADNFALLVLGAEKVKSPEVLEKIRVTLVAPR